MSDTSNRTIWLPESISAWLDKHPDGDLRIGLGIGRDSDTSYVVSLWTPPERPYLRERCHASADGPAWEVAMTRLSGDLATEEARGE